MRTVNDSTNRLDGMVEKLRDQGLRITPQRLAVLKILAESNEHPSVEMIHKSVRPHFPTTGLATIYKIVSLLKDLGEVNELDFSEVSNRYDGKNPFPHPHLICTKCGKIVEFENQEMERLQRGIAAYHGFHMLQHRMEIYGLCAQCLSQRRPLMPLSMAKAGERVVLREMAGGATARARLADMGLRLGDRIEIITNTGQGRLILGRGYTRLAVGRGIAQKIMVSLTDK